MDRKVMQRIVLVLLALVMLLSIVAPVVMATEAETTETTEAVVRGEFECGDDLTWSYQDGTLTISGTGAMDDYEGDAPWAAHKNEITKVVLEGVTYVGARAFNDYDAIKEVDFGSALYELGAQAFRSCEGLTSVTMPATFKVFGEECFNSCTNLKEIHCNGKFPSFRQNCLWAVYATIYYPAAAPWSVTYIEQLETAFKGRIEFLASDGTDHYTPTEATEAAKEVTEATTEVTTEPAAETTVETKEVTEETTEMTTEATAEATTEATDGALETSEEPLPETSEELLPAETEKSASKGWIGLVIMGSVLALLVLGGVVFGGKTNKSGRFSKR